MNNLKKDIELIFRNSQSSGELFDYFIKAMNNKINDAGLYKTLLWNRVLSNDEISMYAEKICREFPELSYSIFLWVGQIFEIISEYGKYYDNAIYYYIKASSFDPKSHEPYSAILKLSITELDITRLNELIQIIKQGINSVSKKSILCFGLSDIYNKIEDLENKIFYQKLGEKYRREGN
jgi:hypothetical protein